MGYLVLFLLSMLITYQLFIFTQSLSLPDSALARFYLLSGCIVFTAGALIAWITCYRNTYKALILTICTTAVFLLFMLAAIPAIDTRTILPLANIIKLKLKPQDEVITYNQYYQDLPFYLERRVTILNWRNEMRHGMDYQDTSQWMIDNKTFWQRWNSKQHVFVIMSSDEFQKWRSKHPHNKAHVLGETSSNVLISNY